MQPHWASFSIINNRIREIFIGSVSHWNFPEMDPWMYFKKHNAQQKVQFNSCVIQVNGNGKERR